SANRYKSKKGEAEDEIEKGEEIIKNGDGSEEQISKERNRVNEGINGLNKGKKDLGGDKCELEEGYKEVIENVDRNDKKGGSIEE
ncbi:hypothetical protein, partial [Staphylococcus epidermidis]|uniref:hypothetical protein n=1 Tax=Staphylococcus epidermidis TaxID=1282 RepID=UPI0016434657